MVSSQDIAGFINYLENGAWVQPEFQTKTGNSSYDKLMSEVRMKIIWVSKNGSSSFVQKQVYNEDKLPTPWQLIHIS